MAPVLTAAIVVMWGLMTAQRIRHRGAIVTMDADTFTVIAFTARTFRLEDLERAELSEDGRLLGIYLTDGRTHQYGAKFWDRSPGEVATLLTAAAEAKRDGGISPTVSQSKPPSPTA